MFCWVAIKIKDIFKCLFIFFSIVVNIEITYIDFITS